MNQITQKEKILQKINASGYVNNFWAIQNNILRLGARIWEMRKEGYDFREDYGTGTNRKNYFYFLTKKPHANP